MNRLRQVARPSFQFIPLFLLCFAVSVDVVSSFNPSGLGVPVVRPSPFCSSYKSIPSSSWSSRTVLFDADPLEEYAKRDDSFDIRTTFFLVGGQSALILIAAAAALITKTPNWGFGPNFSLSLNAIGTGALLSAPLGLMAAALDLVEDRFPALQDVTRATQRSVLALMGSTFKPVLGLAVASALGIAAGFGEEMLFRGVLQYEVSLRLGAPVAVVLASIIFGALHAVTPLYAGLASIASVYFGVLYLMFDLNLAVPIAAHTVYDIVALFYAHKTVADLSPQEREDIANWDGPGS